jgi:Tol biopolymer transport system component
MNIKHLLIILLLLTMVFSCTKSNTVVLKLNELQKKEKWKIIFNSEGSSLYAFSFKDENTEIYVNKNSFINASSLSKDGKLIVFSTEKIVEEDSDILVMNSDGTGVHKLFSYKRVKGTSLSPDGKKIAFWGDYNDIIKSKNMYLYDIEENKIKLLQKEATYSGTAFSPSWSPDSKQIVYSSLDGYITVINIDDLKTKKLIQGDAPSWSPDGKTIVYREGISYFRELPDKETTEYYIEGHKYFAIEPTGENNRFIFDGKPRIWEVGDNAFSPVVWSPDSKYILFFKPYDSLIHGPNRSRIYIFDVKNKKTCFIKKQSETPFFSWSSLK